MKDFDINEAKEFLKTLKETAPERERRNSVKSKIIELEPFI